MPEPSASRPYMPGYGILPASEGRGLLPWTWAEDRLRSSHDYWLATVRPEGRPHVMPVWGAWFEASLWFCSGHRSRKVRNLDLDPRCVLTTDDAVRPVVLEGRAEVVRDMERLRAFLAVYNDKYETTTELDFLHPAVNRTYRVAPEVVFALDDEDFHGSPTRWRFT